jgi:hypothetical protein
MSVFRQGILAAAMLGVGAPAFAAIGIDGTKDAEYGSALAVQTVQTGFGDNASEWNAGYAVVSGGRLYVMLTGNLENNFNKLEIFIDSKTGGQSIFDSSGNDGAGAMDGLKFDTGFTADYHLIARRGDGKFDLDLANLVAQTEWGFPNIFAGSDSGSGQTLTGDLNASPIGVGYNGSNTAGVGGDAPNAADQTAAQAVTTGLEFSIALSDIGYAGGDIRIMIGQNNQNHNYWSNQFLGGLAAPKGNLGGDENGGFTGEGAIDMTNFAGDQFFTVAVPEPTSIGIIGGAIGLGLLRRRSRLG